jgi:DNA-binding HxlR family transcriptional regulator
VFADVDAAFSAIHEVLGRKWHLRIVYHLLEDGPLGFSDLKDRLDGVSSKMLSESLSSLEEDSLVAREIVSDQPVRVKYSLTERGMALEAVVEELLQWGTAHAPSAEAE